MSAAEVNYQSVSLLQPQWLTLAENYFNNQISRWDTSSCNGGLKWQIYPQNSYGYDYKNSISNGRLFQLAARLARYTRNQSCIDWANAVWDWTTDVGLIDDSYNVMTVPTTR